MSTAIFRGKFFDRLFLPYQCLSFLGSANSEKMVLIYNDTRRGIFPGARKLMYMIVQG